MHMSSFFQRLTNFFTSARKEDEAGYWIFLGCDRCGELLRVRINLFNDLSVDYEGEKNQTYFCRKIVVGKGGCFQRIEVELLFDRDRRLLQKDISGGYFINQGEYQAGNQ